MTARSRQAAPDESLSIGDLIELLRDEFPDVSVSKIRFLEAQGLISPARTDSGYRQFGPAEIKRLRYILALQRDHFLPLKVIKSKLTIWDRGEDPGIGDEGVSVDPNGEPVAATDLLRRSGLTKAQVAELVSHSVLPSAQGPEQLFPGWALPAAVEARHLLEMGYEPRHLRQIRLAADRGVELLRQLVNPLLSSPQPEVRQRAREALESGTEAVAALQRILLEAQIRSMIGE